jgi:uncharacterized protein YhaN
VFALTKRLHQALEIQAESARLSAALHSANHQVKAALETLQTTEASLKPLLERAGVETHALLLTAIQRSDQYRGLTDDWAEIQQQFLTAGDGLTRSQLEAEVASVNLVQVGAELASIEEELSRCVQRQSTLSAELANASRILAEIGGSDAAAQAEAQRQEALAKMTDVSERYIKVFTAERLLRWSIERYR